MPEGDLSSVVPAQLAFLAIYNPLIAPTGDSISDQIVFYTSRSSRLRRIEGSSAGCNIEESQNEWNERLRQIGLAQAMVDFARNFSEGKPVDSVETDKARVVIHELEKNWWILASIDLTRLPSSHASGVTSPNNAADSPAFRYSSREMCPPHLLIQQLRRGYSTFLLHHDFTLDDLYRRVDRSAFSTLLDRFWMKFAWTWDVLLSGNPAVDIYNGIKLSVGGEIGVGVGEEEWGSGERAVLEDFTARSEGLVDLIVSRFGDPPAPVEDTGSPKTSAPPTNENDEAQWLGCEDCARPSDGVVFSGVGAISRGSLLQVSQWMEWIYRYGDDAYGVCDDPTSTRPRRQRKKRTKMAAKDANNLSAMTTSRHSAQEHSFSPGIPKPLVMGGSQPFQSADKPRNSPRGERSPEWNARSNDWSGLNSESFMKVLTLGYGSSWSFPSLMLNTQPDASGPKQEDSTGETRQSCHGNGDAEDMSTADGPKRPSAGRFIIGLREDLHNSDERSPDKSMTSNSRILHRKLHIRMAAPEPTDKKLQVIIYVNQPFMYTFLFDPEAPSLTDPALYANIQHQLDPLHKPLSTSTSPATATARISMSEAPLDPSNRFTKDRDQPIYELVYDPTNLTVRSSIPNIPDLGSHPPPEVVASDDPRSPAWSRVESLNIHHRLLSTYHETRSRGREVERTCKTSRGWWIIWVRLSGSTEGTTSRHHSGVVGSDPPQEAFLIRKASDYLSPSGHVRGGSAARFFRDLGGSSSALGSQEIMAPGKIVEGLGLDARRYIENLLSLNR